MKPICLFVNLLVIAFFNTNAGYAQLPFPPKQRNIDSMRNVPVRLVPQDLYSNNLSFFCKKELQVEKLTKIPFRVRLGSLDYVNSLEGKGQNLFPRLKPGAK